MDALIARIEYHRSIMVFNGLCPAYRENRFEQIGIMLQRNTRNCYEQKLYVPFSKLQMGKMQILCQKGKPMEFVMHNTQFKASLSQIKVATNDNIAKMIILRIWNFEITFEEDK